MGKEPRNLGRLGKFNSPAPVTSATLPSREADARPRGPGMALYLPFFAGAGPSWNSSVIACLPFSTVVPFVPLVPLMGRGVSSVKPGAIFVMMLCRENLAQVCGRFGLLGRK